MVLSVATLVMCQGPFFKPASQAAGMAGSTARDNTLSWCQQANVTCYQNCRTFGNLLDRVSFDCKNSTSVDLTAVVEAATCMCLGANDVILSSSSSSGSRNVGGGGQASSSSFASSVGA